MRNKLFFGLLIAVALPLAVFGARPFTGFIDSPTNVSQVIDTLTANDSTACFPWNGREMVVTVGPGITNSKFFSTTVTGDSFTTRLFLRGWTTANRTQLMFVTPLWSYAAPYMMFKLPRANTWLNLSSTSPSDSATKTVYTDRTVLSSGTAAGVNATDSLRIALLYAQNKILSEFAPYYDIIKSDSTGATGKNHTVKVTVTQYKEAR